MQTWGRGSINPKVMRTSQVHGPIAIFSWTKCRFCSVKNLALTHFTLRSEMAFRIGRSFSHITSRVRGDVGRCQNLIRAFANREEREPVLFCLVRPLQRASQQEFASDSLGHHHHQEPLVRPSLTNLSTSYQVALQRLLSEWGTCFEIGDIHHRTRETLLNEDLRIRLERGVR